MPGPSRLPPLPPIGTWRTHFPRKLLSQPGVKGQRVVRNRYVLAGDHVTDRFARSLKIRKDEVVLDMWCGTGASTRSLLAGGRSRRKEDEACLPEWQEYKAAQGDKKAAQKSFPSWLKDIKKNIKDIEWERNLSREGESPLAEESTNLPALVVAAESSPELLVRGLGLKESQTPPKWTPEERIVALSDDHFEHPGPPGDIPLFQSDYEPRLKLACANPFLWHVPVKILYHPDLQPYLQSAGVTSDTKWTGPPPHVTAVFQLAHDKSGEQMAGQLVGSVVGGPEGAPGYIWRLGRLRMGILAKHSIYDRLLARPGDSGYSKLSVMTRALFDITPIAPRHQVPDKFAAKNKKLKEAVEATLNADLPRDITYLTDFYPYAEAMYVQKHVPIRDDPKFREPMDRPRMMGVLLEPKLESPVNTKNKECWDYILRHCFVRPSHTVNETIPLLGFAANKLLDLITKDVEGYEGAAVDGEKMIRHLDVDEWARIVDVFYKWPFKPSNLSLLSTISSEETDAYKNYAK